tara:strand:- start:136 stop:477 length:342 start_codon:yes stop_codon:yes gene_type:complete
MKDTTIVSGPSRNGALEVAKWKKPKENNSEKIAYSKIKQAEKITIWNNVAYPDKDAMALEEEWKKRKTRMFAKHCWENLGAKAPSGKRWEEVFEEKEGINLVEYVSDLARKKL